MTYEAVVKRGTSRGAVPRVHVGDRLEYDTVSMMQVHMRRVCELPPGTIKTVWVASSKRKRACVRKPGECAHIASLCAGAVVASAMGRDRVVPGTIAETRSASVGTGTTLWLRGGDGRVVAVDMFALPLRGTVGVRGMGEVLVCVWEIELEECG